MSVKMLFKYISPDSMEVEFLFSSVIFYINGDNSLFVINKEDAKNLALFILNNINNKIMEVDIEKSMGKGR